MGMNDDSTVPLAEGEEKLPESETPREPSRYRVVAAPGGRCVVCGAAENVKLHVERGLVVNEAGRKKYPERTIFLDGVYTGPPFYDNKARHYSLDHHTGCVRAFTLATCEQAAVMIVQGLPLEEGEWCIHVNDPDLDAVLAAWILLNHGELLRDDEALLHRVMPLVRVEGVIDAHGLDMGVLAAMPRETYEEKKRQIDLLLSRERTLKATSSWLTSDPLQYSCDLLAAMDALLFPASALSKLLEVEELQRVAIQGQRLAILCRSSQGIYDVEVTLKERYDKALGLIVLDLGSGRYTVRQVDPFLDQNLVALYEALNLRDGRVVQRGEQGGEEDNRWGGSEDIGGSPRRTGSALSGEEVLSFVQQLYGGSGGWIDRLIRRIRS
jgi:hypothetical protein